MRHAIVSLLLFFTSIVGGCNLLPPSVIEDGPPLIIDDEFQIPIDEENENEEENLELQSGT